MKKKIISFPRNLINAVDTYNFLLDVLRIVKNSDENYIFFDFSDTKVLETNLLAIILLFLDELNDEK